MKPTSLSEIQKTPKRYNFVPVRLEMSADLMTPVTAYLRLALAGKKAFLLESVEGGERLARYSFLGVDPFEWLTIREEGVLYSGTPDDPSGKRVDGNPVRMMGKRLKAFSSPELQGMPPFTGGAVGYLGYECFRHLEKVSAPAHRVNPYDAQLMIFRNVVAFDHVAQKIVLIGNILMDRETLKKGYQRVVGELEKLQNALLTPSREEKTLRTVGGVQALEPSEFKTALGVEGFKAGVRKIRQHIKSGDIFQCVLSEQFEIALRGRTDSFSIYRTLRRLSPSPYLFHLSFGDETLLGASPEMLARVSDGKVETCPIAGTRPRGRDEKEDKKFERSLLASEKERAEHLMLVDLGRNDLGRVSAPGEVRVRNFMQVERFSHVMHLVSLVEGKLGRGRTAWDALMSCFPAGTLSGAPKIRAIEILSGIEPVQRGPYGGAVVYHGFSGRMDSCIAIRSLYLRDGTAYLRAGAGIVADSTPEREYQEVLNKTRALRLALAEALQ